MLIVTQIGEIVNLGCVERIFVDGSYPSGEGEVVAFTVGGKYETLGFYKSEKRAGTVLREIAETYKRQSLVIDITSYIIKKESSAVYRMPEA